jgi:hypothetical protein
LCSSLIVKNIPQIVDLKFLQRGKGKDLLQTFNQKFAKGLDTLADVPDCFSNSRNDEPRQTHTKRVIYSPFLCQKENNEKLIFMSSFFVAVS